MKREQIFGKTLFVDLMMGTLVVVTALLIASNAIEKAKKQKDEASLAPEGKFAIIMEWPKDSKDDVDLYVRDPVGNIVYFQSRDSGLMHLEHDDRGGNGDTVMTPYGPITVDANEERTIIRGIVPGEYVVNVHMFNKAAPEPTVVKVRLLRTKGADNTVVEKQRTLERNGDEQTAFRFTLGEDESVTNVNDLQTQFVGATASQAGPAQNSSPFTLPGGF